MINVKPLGQSSTGSSSGIFKNNLNIKVSGLNARTIQRQKYTSSIQLGQENNSIVDQALNHDKAMVDPLKMSFGI